MSTVIFSTTYTLMLILEFETVMVSPEITITVIKLEIHLVGKVP